MRHSDEKMILIYVVGLFYVNKDINRSETYVWVCSSCCCVCGFVRNVARSGSTRSPKWVRGHANGRRTQNDDFFQERYQKAYLSIYHHLSALIVNKYTLRSSSNSI
jgi:hypothetical protein